MTKLYSAIFFFLLISANFGFSQPSFSPYAPLFDSSVVARIDITVNPDTLEWIYDNVDSDIEFHAGFGFNNGTINDTVQDVGFRLRGNTSRYAQKKSFKISFNTFVQGRKFYGIEKMNLNGEHNDPSIVRARLCWDWLNQFGIPAPRATHVRVYINGDYYGLYIMVEQIDEQFLSSRFGNNEGNLYECLWPADLDYIGSNPDLYKFTAGDRRAYQLKTNTGLDDYSDLANFIDILNNTPTADLACALDEVFNLQDYLKIIAMDVITSNWDGYIYNKNNFFLYHNTETGKFEYVPYDLDNTFGIDWFGIDWGNRSIYNWQQVNGEVRPLYTRLMAVPEIRDQYTYYMKQLLQMLGNTDSLFAEIDSLRNLISPYVINDPYHSLDYGYTFADFMNSYNTDLGAHVTYGLKPYLAARIQSAGSQAENHNIKPSVKYIKSSKAIAGQDYWVRAFVEDEDPQPGVQLQYRLNVGQLQTAMMYDDGAHHDKDAGDGYFGCVLSPLQINQTLSWQVSATDNNSHATMLPCSPVTITFLPSSDPQLFINELMAGNDSTIADEYGEYDDWAEIYNGDTEPVYLGDKYLSDNLENPDKWQLPDVTMQPGEFLLIWCDGQPEQGSSHANYKLSNGGEELGIFDSETTGYYLIDSVTFGLQQLEISYGRQDDGLTPWIYFQDPTPGSSNNPDAVPENEKNSPRFYFYPNPVHDGTLHFLKPFSGRMTDLSGRMLWEGTDVMEISTTRMPDGMYIITNLAGDTAKCVILQGK
jgi:spore coat protein CotH